MHQACPNCGNPGSSSDECSLCAAPKEKATGWMGSLVVTGIVIGVMISGTLLAIQSFGNPLDYLNYFRRSSLHEITRASEDLPVLRDRIETITLDQIAELREYFENQQFDELTAILEAYQRGFEISAEDEYKVSDAFRVFAGTLPRYEELFNRWVAHSPTHYAPYLARGNYYYARGWESRGNQYAKDTSQEQFREMRFYFRKAADDLNMALSINSYLVRAYVIQIGIFNATGDHDGENSSFRRALELFPNSFQIRAKFMWAKAPRWGGTYREMENFAIETEQYAASNPELTALFGFILYDQSRRMVSQKKYAQAVDLCTRALDFGDNWLFYHQRAHVHYFYLKDSPAALHDINRSIYLRPTIEKSYRLRSKIYFKNGDMQNAMDDILRAELIKPGDAKIKSWRTWVGKNLTNRGNTVFEQDKNEAIELYSLAIQFDPRYAEAYYWRGVAHYSLMQIDAARGDIEMSIDINPLHFESYLMMDHILVKSRQWDTIVDYWNQFLALEPDHAGAYLERAGTYYHRKDFANSLEDLKTACELGSEEACQRFNKYKDIWR